MEAEGLTKGRRMRSDASRRREALLVAATQCFNESGYMVPLDQIADRAGVGRGTLYRNFQDRLELALAVFNREVESFEGLVRPEMAVEEALEAFVRHGLPTVTLFRRLAPDLAREGERRLAFKALGAKMVEYLRPVVDHAHRQHLLREDIGPEQLLIITRMIHGLIFSHMTEAEVDHQIETALTLLMPGLKPFR